MYYDTASSSPPSSPATQNNSSPPSSPSGCNISEDSDDYGFNHPFAGSAKANRTPRRGAPLTPDTSFDFDTPVRKKARSNYRISPEPTEEERIFELSIDTAIGNGDGLISLQNRNLAYIPGKIGELAAFTSLPKASEPSQRTYNRHFVRSETEPTQASSRTFSRTRSLVESAPVGMAREELKIYLQDNRITRLPREIFTLKKLTVLSLRKNNLRFIPTAISHLTSLTELNIANNEIEFVPFTMMEMHHLSTLVVHPNRRFIQEPPGREFVRTRSRPNMVIEHHRPVGKTKHLMPRVPPLTELCLRKLIAVPNSRTDSSPGVLDTTLANYYGYPVQDHYGVPSHLAELLNTCVPGCIPGIPSSDSESNGETSDREAGILCANPLHRDETSLASMSRFACPSTSRFTWESNIGGASVGGRVPVRWLGCSSECLDFLDPPTTAVEVIIPETGTELSAEDAENQAEDEDEELGQAEIEESDDYGHADSTEDVNMRSYDSDSSTEFDAMFFDDSTRLPLGYGDDDSDV